MKAVLLLAKVCAPVVIVWLRITGQREVNATANGLVDQDAYMGNIKDVDL